ncbi:MAG: phage integrase N-terminal SAM-like domain-containing protein, partial [Solimonas sp.]
MQVEMAASKPPCGVLVLSRWPGKATSPRASVAAHPAPVTAPEPYESAESRILDQLRRMLRTREYSLRTERSYAGWIRRFLRFHGKTADHPDVLAAAHATSFLEHLALT